MQRRTDAHDDRQVCVMKRLMHVIAGVVRNAYSYSTLPAVI